MAENIWAELDLDRWTWEVPRSTPGPYVAEHIPKPLIIDWVEKWKPIINDALEKAENLETIKTAMHKIVDPLADQKRPLNTSQFVIYTVVGELLKISKGLDILEEKVN